MTTNSMGRAEAESLPLRSVTAYLSVADTRAAIRFYEQAFGAIGRHDPYIMEDGSVGHAELAIGDSVLMLADESPENDMMSPLARGGSSVTLLLQVDDVDATLSRAVESGATLTRPPKDESYGRNGVVKDPFGHRWMISSPPSVQGTASARAEMRQGDVGYASVWVPDIERAAEFYASVLGWTYGPGSDPRGRQVEGRSVPLGLWETEGSPTLLVLYVVDDIDAAIDRVRAAGGRTDGARDEPYGRTADCFDDQDMPFSIYEPAPGSPQPASPKAGDVNYITIETVDSTKARAFFTAVLGWSFTPGSVEDGWGVQIQGAEVNIMTGLHGGRERPRPVPMYQVDDIASAVAAVRAAGGSATNPERMPYGITSDCTDDQGSRFYLGQMS
jgi:predicted enzyme related to lactoylglutathione lyase